MWINAKTKTTLQLNPAETSEVLCKLPSVSIWLVIIQKFVIFVLLRVLKPVKPQPLFTFKGSRKTIYK